MDHVANPELPVVSVVIPARNEECCLAACLQSLIAQNGTTFEIIVVDDGSADRTKEIAQSFAGVQVIEAPSLPDGWVGKNHAVDFGAKYARGKWLLLTDADTMHLPGSLARAVAEAEQRGADLLSYSPQQLAHGFLEKALQPVVFADLAATHKPSQVSNPALPVAAANGQYFLVRRNVYQSVGGHAAIADSILEDVTLAQLIKASGYRIFFRYGGDAVQTRMYRSFRELCAGWSKNLALLFKSPGLLATLRLGEFLLIPGFLAAAIVVEIQAHPMVAVNLALLSLLLYCNFYARIRRAHASFSSNLLAYFGLPLFAFLLLRSRRMHRRGALVWKGRSYKATKARASAEINRKRANHASMGEASPARRA